MKNVIFINGTMGSGKTSVLNYLGKHAFNNIILDGDWCWKSNPFICNENSKKMVIENITFLLNNFIKLEDIQNIFFCWVMPEEKVIEEIKTNLFLDNCNFYLFTLMCEENTLIKRLNKDIENNIRDKEDLGIINRAIDRMKNYSKMNR